MVLDELYRLIRPHSDAPIDRDTRFDENFPRLYQEFCPGMTPIEAADTAIQYYLSGMWRLTKVVYTADPIFLEALTQSEDTPLYTEVLRRLPFPTFYVHCPGPLSLGYLIHIEFHPGGDCLLAVCEIGQEQGDITFLSRSLWFHDGDTIQKALDALLFHLRAQDEPVVAPPPPPDADLETSLAVYRRLLSAALPFAYYLASQNADIRPVKSGKGTRFLRKNGTPLRIQTWDVGFRVGCTVAQMYRSDRSGEMENPQKLLRASSRRPHIRRAHWHHYWTGKGRSVLVVRWLLPILIHGDPDKLIPISHQAE